MDDTAHHATQRRNQADQWSITPGAAPLPLPVHSLPPSTLHRSPAWLYQRPQRECIDPDRPCEPRPSTPPPAGTPHPPLHDQPPSDSPRVRHSVSGFLQIGFWKSGDAPPFLLVGDHRLGLCQSQIRMLHDAQFGAKNRGVFPAYAARPSLLWGEGRGAVIPVGGFYLGGGQLVRWVRCQPLQRGQW
jgi:hypothetical protein